MEEIINNWFLISITITNSDFIFIFIHYFIFLFFKINFCLWIFQSSHSSRDLSPITPDANEFRHLYDVVEKLSVEQGTYVDKLRQTESKEMVNAFCFFIKFGLRIR